jgi:hypothetical protein
MGHPGPALIPVWDDELGNRAFGAGNELKAKSLDVEGAAPEAMAVEAHLHDG